MAPFSLPLRQLCDFGFARYVPQVSSDKSSVGRLQQHVSSSHLQAGGAHGSGGGGGGAGGGAIGTRPDKCGLSSYGAWVMGTQAW